MIECQKNKKNQKCEILTGLWGQVVQVQGQEHLYSDIVFAREQLQGGPNNVVPVKTSMWLSCQCGHPGQRRHQRPQCRMSRSTVNIAVKIAGTQRSRCQWGYLPLSGRS